MNTTTTRNCNDCSAPTTNDWMCKDCEILSHALTAFWAVVAAAHPEIRSGDGDDSDFRRFARQEIARWISNNSVTCDACGRDCTADGKRSELLETGHGSVVRCEDCLPQGR